MTCPRCERLHALDQPCLRGVVVVCGGRNYRERAHVFRTLDRVAARVVITRLRHGACGLDEDEAWAPSKLRGADRWAHEWALECGLGIEPMPAWWKREGHRAGPLRNQAMIDAGDIACVVAFPGGNGTADLVRRSKAAGLLVWEVR